MHQETRLRTFILIIIHNSQEMEAIQMCINKKMVNCDIHTTRYYAAIKTKELLIHVTWMNLTNYFAVIFHLQAPPSFLCFAMLGLGLREAHFCFVSWLLGGSANRGCWTETARLEEENRPAPSWSICWISFQFFFHHGKIHHCIPSEA